MKMELIQLKKCLLEGMDEVEGCPGLSPEPTVCDGWRGPLPDLLKYVRLTWGGDAKRGG